MIKKSLFGQYKYKKSFLHSLDPRLKITYVIILSILVFTANNFYEMFIFSVLVLIIAFLAKIGIKSLAMGLRSFSSVFIFIFLMYILFARNKIGQGVITLWRFLILIIISFALTYTTTISGLVTSIEKLSKPLKLIRIKPRNIALMISIAVRFIPVMFINLERIREGMLSRLADFRKLKNIKILMVVLLERMLKSATNLSEALQARLYDENIECRKIMKFNMYDYLSIVFILVFSAIIIIY